MLGTKEHVNDEDLAARARELADLLNRLPLPPLPSSSQIRPNGDSAAEAARAPRT